MVTTLVDLGIPGYGEAEEIGRGGFAVVYRAQRERFRDDVAIKLMNGVPDDERALRRIDRELTAVGIVAGHRNLVTVYAADWHSDGRPYIVMELVPGGTLAERVRRDGPLSWNEVVEIGVVLAAALQWAHERGVIHRDIKPENVLIDDRFVETRDRIRLGDFGIAAIQGRTVTSDAWSVAHVAPEVILVGEAPTVAADVYGLASTLYQLLDGDPPFTREDDVFQYQALGRMQAGAFGNLRDKGIPDAVATVIEHGLRRDPAERPATAAEFAALLTAAGETATAEAAAAAAAAEKAKAAAEAAALEKAKAEAAAAEKAKAEAAAEQAAAAEKAKAEVAAAAEKAKADAIAAREAAATASAPSAAEPQPPAPVDAPVPSAPLAVTSSSTDRPRSSAATLRAGRVAVSVLGVLLGAVFLIQSLPGDGNGPGATTTSTSSSASSSTTTPSDILLEDDFSNARTGWPVLTQATDQTKAEYSDGAYRVTVQRDVGFRRLPAPFSQKPTPIGPFPTGALTIEATVTFQPPASAFTMATLYCGGGAQSLGYYTASIQGDGFWRISRYDAASQPGRTLVQASTRAEYSAQVSPDHSRVRVS